jgi:hypothetical protein
LKSFSFGAFQAWVCQIVATVRAHHQHMVARLPVGKIDRRETVVLSARIICPRCSDQEILTGSRGMKERSTTCWQLLYEANVGISVSHRDLDDIARAANDALVTLG